MPRKKTPALKRVPKQRYKRRTSARSWLEKQPKEELIEFILVLAQEHPRISELLADRSNLKQGNIDARREIERGVFDIEAVRQAAPLRNRSARSSPRISTLRSEVCSSWRKRVRLIAGWPGSAARKWSFPSISTAKNAICYRSSRLEECCRPLRSRQPGDFA